MKTPTLTVLALALACAGCGYHVAGRADLIPRDIKTIAVPAFANGTIRYKLARQLPADITRELISRTRYNIVAEPEQADAVLHGALVNFIAYPTTSDPSTGRATSVEVVATVSVTLTNRHTGKVLYSRDRFEYRQRYEVPVDPKAYFDESGTTIERVSRDVARTVVSGILEAF
jgi:outer membrane lipopolysaccharide assembly protein LptE/RlpB